MLALSSNLPLKLSTKIAGFRPFEKFRSRSKENADGWGLAAFEGPSAHLFREVLPAGRSGLYGFLEDYDRLESRIFIVHVRETSVGANSLRNTHPFLREHKGRTHVFAHNGTLKNFTSLSLGIHQPVGETDSEHAFCHLLSKVDRLSSHGWTRKDMADLQEFFQRVNRLGPFNGLYSDGDIIFCYHDQNGYNGMVFFQEKTAVGSTIVLANKPLSDHPWKAVNRGQLIALRAGEKIY